MALRGLHHLGCQCLRIKDKHLVAACRLGAFHAGGLGDDAQNLGAQMLGPSAHQLPQSPRCAIDQHSAALLHLAGGLEQVLGRDALEQDRCGSFVPKCVRKPDQTVSGEQARAGIRAQRPGGVADPIA
ncbi:hypothetical protein SDC9_212039 [bioreactor metagenome]|uniref:Uncharacterized protein n=1 Tax=bioreactor metagenome TaxID=1076179 RepID=A0A645JKR5_9ZZZZ